MIKAVIFDIGGVVIDLKPWFNKFVKIFRPENAEEFWKDFNAKVIPLCKNQISEKMFLNKLATSYNIPFDNIPSDILVKDFEKLTSVNKHVMKIIKELKRKYKLALLSNTINSHSKSIKKKINYDYFDLIILSNKIGLTKDQKEIFLLVAKKLNVKTSECVFVDDIQEFIKVSESAGMKGILFKNPEQLKRELRKLLCQKIK